MSAIHQKHEMQVKLSRHDIHYNQWDRMTFYKFLSTMRIRNNHNFSWWTLCNTAASYGSGSATVGVYSGYNIAQKSMVKKLGRLYNPADITEKTKNTLKDGPKIGIAIFDNSQNFRKLKFQRFRKSSSVTLTTSRCFVKPTIQNISICNDDHVNITYLNQVIPSPIGLPAFEDFALSSDVFDVTKLTVSDNAMDMTGNRVESYALNVLIAGSIMKFQRLICYCNDGTYSFQNKEIMIKLEKLQVKEKLSKINLPNLRGEQSFLKNVKKFQKNVTNLWRGEYSKAQLIIPPISPEDETTIKGAAKVVLSL